MQFMVEKLPKPTSEAKLFLKPRPEVVERLLVAEANYKAIDAPLLAAAIRCRAKELLNAAIADAAAQFKPGDVRAAWVRARH